MQVDPLIPMLNRIGEFFEAQPDEQAALKDIANHVRLFWEPRMRHSLLDFLEQNPEGKTGGLTIHPLVLVAIHRYKDELRPTLA